MLLQAAALGCSPLSDGAVGLAAAAAAVLLGVGTALVYPTLIAAISDAVSPVARAPTVGVYRFWRDMGDALSYSGAIAIVAGLTATSGLYGLRSTFARVYVALDTRSSQIAPATPTGSVASRASGSRPGSTNRGDGPPLPAASPSR